MTHLFDVLSVRWRDHLWGQTLRRVQAFGQLQIDQMKRQCKLLSSQFPNVSNVTKLPENTNRGRLHKSVMIYTSGNGYFWLSDWSSCSGVMETKIHYSENRAEANQPYEGKNPYVWYCSCSMCQPALQCRHIPQQYYLQQFIITIMTNKMFSDNWVSSKMFPLYITHFSKFLTRWFVLEVGLQLTIIFIID